MYGRVATAGNSRFVVVGTRDHEGVATVCFVGRSRRIKLVVLWMSLVVVPSLSQVSSATSVTVWVVWKMTRSVSWGVRLRHQRLSAHGAITYGRVVTWAVFVMKGNVWYDYGGFRCDVG